MLNVFEFRRQLIADYAAYVRGFIAVADPKIRGVVDSALNEGALWPEPLVQMNPAFEPGGWIDELADEKVLHEECRQIFRRKTEEDPVGQPMRLHRHQEDAIRSARRGGNYVLTTGTGSGKSLAYIIPIVDHVLRRGPGKGIQAVIVYPMNALANSQAGELEKFLRLGFPDRRGPVTYARYTGQENDEKRQSISANPPDILLTNYVMLELLLTRPFERRLVEAGRGLRFLVLDELHTYRGRQGADVALLVRRARDAFEASSLQCVGTSATMAGPGTLEEQRHEVARVASQLFGASVPGDNVITETLRRSTRSSSTSAAALAERMRQEPSPAPTYEQFTSDPLSTWLETALGLAEESGSGRLIRRQPRPVRGPEGAAAELASTAGVSVESAAVAIESCMQNGYAASHPETGFPAFAFRLHQFISKGDTVYATPEDEQQRSVTLNAQQFAPGSGRSRVLLPLAFCRECGQEYYTVHLVEDVASGTRRVEPRAMNERGDQEDGKAGFLYFSSANPWPVDPQEVLEALPEDMVDVSTGARRLRREARSYVPESVDVHPDGTVTQGRRWQFLRAPFRFCLRCGVAYTARQKTDFSKLSTLGSEGRSTATTILSLSVVRHLRASGLPLRARKLLSFTDNRQDASLQAGHFNDFVQIGLLRAALHKACSENGDVPLEHDVLAQRVFTALNLPFPEYASNPEARFGGREDTERAFRDLIGYRIYRDLQRGWRITAPNLEQTDLLRIEYRSLDELCASEDDWKSLHSVLAGASSETRKNVASVLLDFMRRELAIKVSYLNGYDQEQIHRRAQQHLKSPWGFDENEPVTALQRAPVLYPRSRREQDYGGHVFLSPLSGFGQFLRRQGTFPGLSRPPSTKETQTICLELLSVLRLAGIVEIVAEPNANGDVPGYQLQAAAFRWLAGPGEKAPHDPLRRPSIGDGGGRVNPFFVDYYKSMAGDAKGLTAREHTAQVDQGAREFREKEFREGRLPILYCSPTMELGVDIAELNVVNMRNIPPTPANYAQRSGRAGRSGQPALVFSYCTTGSPHDQYFFRRPERMVSGAVTPPRIDLANEDLVRAHVHAIWLRETGEDLGSSLRDVVDLSGTPPNLTVKDSLHRAFEDQQARARALLRAERILGSMNEELSTADWFTSDWLASELSQVAKAFDDACIRWRDLYRAAWQQRQSADAVIIDHTRSNAERDQARRMRAEAESQLDLLVSATQARHADFYSYRYFASEGFLPGYSFPRLPLSAYIPARRGDRGEDEYLSRSRFLAITEFGPKSFVYHEGAKYVINRVMLPARANQHGQTILTSEAKQCEHCGYLHPMSNGHGADLCEDCHRPLGQPMRSLFRLQNVATKRRDRISSDEEERFRMGYDLRTAIRFAHTSGPPSRRLAEVDGPDGRLASMTYGHAATVWRINLGWSRRGRQTQPGFLLDVEKGFWKADSWADDQDDDDPAAGTTARVVPYVEDRKNCLLLTFERQIYEAQSASLQAALKNAIQVCYQLEDGELAAEPLPTRDRRSRILFFESAEGGAGVLRRLTENTDALRQVANAALELCHFDPESGADRRRHPRAKEDCEAACYDCLMSYGNQRDHLLLDRHAIKDLLIDLAASRVAIAPGALPRTEHLRQLRNQAGSSLELAWLDRLEAEDLRLPSAAQVLVESCGTRPDFIYRDQRAAIYVDGPVHQNPERARRDARQQVDMEDAGWVVIRFAADDDWMATIARYPNIFGAQ